LEGRIAAELHLVADAKPLHISSAAGADDGVRRYLIGDADAGLDIGPDRIGIAAICARKGRLRIGENVGRHMPLCGAREMGARNHHPVV
jgi:hypothetical protein